MNNGEFPGPEHKSFSTSVEERLSRLFVGVDATTSSSRYGFVEKPRVSLLHGPKSISLRRETTKQVIISSDNQDPALAGTALDEWDEVVVEHILSDTIISDEDDSIVETKPERYMFKFTDYSTNKSGKKIVYMSSSYEFIPSQNPSEVLIIPSKGPAFNPEDEGRDNSIFLNALDKAETLFSTTS